MESKLFDEIPGGERVSIENCQSTGIQISVICNSGCQFDLELLPGQSLGFSADQMGARILLNKGDPEGLLIIQPESAS